MKVIRILTVLLAGVLFTSARPCTAQDPVAGDRPVGASLGFFAGVGSGPAGGSTLGGEAALHLSRFLSLKAEYAGWGGGIPGQNCLDMPPDSHRCSVSGWSGLAGVIVQLPFDPRLEPYAGLSLGQFTRSWLDDSTIRSPARAAEVGVRVRVSRKTSVKLGGKWVNVDDEHYLELLNERLEYTVGTVGFDLRVW